MVSPPREESAAGNSVSKRERREKIVASIAADDLKDEDYHVLFDIPFSAPTNKPLKSKLLSSRQDDGAEDSVNPLAQSSSRKRAKTSVDTVAPPAEPIEHAAGGEGNQGEAQQDGRYSTRGGRKSLPDILKGGAVNTEEKSVSRAERKPQPTVAASAVLKKASPKAATVEEPKQLPLATGGRSSRGKSTAASLEKEEGVFVPPKSNKLTSKSEPILDEVYYFGIYVGYYHDNVYSLTKDKRSLLTITDDTCFLCKDGGDLVECDCVSATNRKVRCLKTYHEGCLGFKIPDDQDFKCLRHFCDVCGSMELKYVCYYCPVSICADCPQAFVEKVNLL